MNVVENEPIYKQISKIMLHEIVSSMHPGAKIASLPQLEKRFGVSPLAIREAVLSLVKDGFLRKRQGSGTYVTDFRKQQVVALLSPFNLISPATSYFFSGLIQELQRHLEMADRSVKFYVGRTERHAGTRQKDEGILEKLLEDIRAFKVGAVISVGATAHPPIIEAAKEYRIPVIGTGTTFEKRVCLDYAKLIDDGLSVLRKKGCSKVAVLGIPGGCIKRDRVEQLYHQHQLAYRTDWVKPFVDPSQSGSGWHHFHQVWQSDDKPDGLLAVDDIYFQELQMALMACKVSIPDELQVVTAINQGNRMFCPFPCTYLTVNTDQLAANITRALIADDPSVYDELLGNVSCWHITEHPGAIQIS